MSQQEQLKTQWLSMEEDQARLSDANDGMKTQQSPQSVKKADSCIQQDSLEKQSRGSIIERG